MELSAFFLIFANDFEEKEKIMCTVTLSYDQNNALARRKLTPLLATGLFSQQIVETVEPTNEEVQTHRQEVEAFLNHSKKSMSHLIARYL